VETPRVETNALLTVREDRTIEEPIMEDPINDENATDLTCMDDITALDTYSLAILLDVTLNR
jgi:hypothetical protein